LAVVQKLWAKISVVSLLTFGLVIPTATPWGISEANAARPNAISGIYTTYTFASAITGVTGNGSEVTFTFNNALKTGTGSDWRVGDYITVTFPSSNSTTTAYNLGQVAITAITSSTITVASTVKVDTAKYPNTVALTGLTSASVGIQAGTLAVTRDPSTGSTPNGCSLGGTMTIAFSTNYSVPQYTSLGQATNGSGVKIAAGSESVDQGIYGNAYQNTKTVNGTVVSAVSNCKGTMYIPEGVKSLSSASGQTGVTNIAFPSTIDVIQAGALSGYTGLVSLNLDPVKYLMTSAFASGCNITSLSLGPTFEFFGKQALQGCANLTAVALPASIRSLGEWTFGGSAVTYFDLPASFTCTEPGLFKETGCDWKIGQYFFGGQSGSTTYLAPQIQINLGNIASASTKTALQHYLGVQTLRGTVTSVNDPNCTVANSCKTTAYVRNDAGNLITDGFARTGMGYNVGNFPSVVFTQNSSQGPEKTFTQSVSDGVTTQLTALSSMSFSKSNNTFVGWNTAFDGSGTTYLDTSSINITSTLTLYAQWSPIYTYTVNLNPGTGGIGTQMTAMTGTAATVVLNANTYSRTGYTFNGWNTAADGSGSSYANQGTVRLTVDNQTVTLYAQWSIITYTITYLPGPNGTSTSSAQTLNYGGSVTLKDASAGFTRIGYSISGWTTSSVSGAAKTNDLSSSYSSLASITLYPVWSAGVYAITYDGQGETTASSGGSTTYTAATAISTIPTTAPLRSGYNFVGWFTAATGGTQVTNASYTPSSPYGAVTLYARWSASTTNAITFDGQGATTAASGGSTTYTTATAVATIPTTAPLRSGYTFAGWFTAATGGTQVTNASYTPSSPYGAITIYARWTALTNNAITYNGQGATTAASGGSTTYTTATAISTIPTTAPLRTGYNFAGWFTAATGGTQVTNGSYTPSSPYGAITIYAQWTADVYSVNFNYGSVSSGSPLFGFTTSAVSSTVSRGSYTYGDPALTLPTVGSMIKTGYSFAGWMLPNGNLLGSSTFTPTATTTLTAKWNIQSFTISYSRGTIGGSAVTGSAPVSQSGNYLSTIILASTGTSTDISGQRYDFAGWSISGTRYPIGSSLQLGASDLTATATWVPVYTVTYILSGGVCVSTNCDDNPQADQSSVTLPVAPSRAGYNFDVWKDQSGASYAAGSNLTVTATSYILTATWTGIQRTVTYLNPNGVGIPTQSNGIYQSTFNVGAAPTRTGYDFGGWSDQDDVIYQSGEIYSVGLTNVTLTATWIPLGIVVTFFNNDGTARSSAQSVIADASTPLTQNSFTRAGYNFGGWNTSSNGGGTPYSDSQNISIISALNLYAQWIAITTNAITYDGQGATTAASGGSTTYTTATAVATIPTTAPLRTGYNFGGWFTAATGGTQVTDGSYTPSSPYGAVTIYAHWSAITTNAISYDGQGATTAASGGSTTYTTATAVATIPTTAPLRSGYNFGGWFSAGTGGTQVTDGSYTPSTPYGAVTIYAQWIAITTNAITFDGQGATTAASGGSTTYTTATAVATIPTTAPLRSGYNFGGWFSASTGGTQITNASYAPSSPYGAITIYAQWIAITTNAITFDGQSATTAASGGSTTYTTATAIVAIPTTAPLRTGYTFVGWFTASTGGTQVTNASYTPSSPYGSITIYAQWTVTPNSTVTFKANGGIGSDTSQSTNVDASLISNTFTYAGYNFAGWNTLANGTGTNYANNASYNFASNLTLFAKWSAKASRTLTFAVLTYSINIGDTVTATASLSVGSGPITYSTGISTACSVDPNTGLVTVTNGIGTCSISASTPEDATYMAITSVAPVVITVGFNIPATPIVTNVGALANTMQLTVTQSDLTTNGINNYKYSVDGTTYISIGSISSPLSITGLTPGIYSVRLKAVNPSGESAPSVALTVIVIAGPSVTVNVPSPAPAPINTGPSAAEIEAAKKAAVDKALAEKEAADKLAAEKAAAEKALRDKEAADKAAKEKEAAEKLAAEKAAADKLAADKAAAEKEAADKLAADKAAAEKAVADKAAAEKAAKDKEAADKLAAEKAAAEKLAAERLLAEKLAAQQALADKLAAEKAAADKLAACILGKSSTLVTAKSKSMRIYSQICFIPELLKPIDKDLAEINKVISLIKSKKIKSITLLSFADEKIGVDFKSVARARAVVVSGIIQRAIPNLKIIYKLYGSSAKKNIVSQGRVVITAN
jgi:uncharacterized repeat protein (TIGR02543 family)